RCALLSSITDGPVPTSIDVTVREVFTPAFGGNAVHCGSEPGGCIVGTAVLTATGSDQRAWASISFLSVDMAAVPSRGLADGATTTVSGSEVPDGTWSLAQCAATYLSGREPAQRDALCSPATAVTVVDGAFAVDMTVSDPLIAVDGSSIPCGYAGCVLDVSSTDSSLHGTSHISFGPPSITTDPAAPFGTADVVDVTLAGLPGDTASVRQCGEPIAADRCDAGSEVALDLWGGATVQDQRPLPMI